MSTARIWTRYEDDESACHVVWLGGLVLTNKVHHVISHKVFMLSATRLTRFMDDESACWTIGPQLTVHTQMVCVQA